MRFTNKDLKNMIIPLFLEQLLVMQVVIHNVFNAFAYPFWGRFRRDFVLREM